jgi:hypothetical protein
MSLSVDAPGAGLAPCRYRREWEAIASLPVMAAAQPRGEEWPVAALNIAEAPEVELSFVVQRAQRPAPVELLAVTARDHADRPGKSLLPPVGLTEALGVRGVRTPFDAAVGATAQELAVMAPAETAPFGLAIASRLSAHDTGESSLVVVSGAQFTMVRAVRAPLHGALLQGTNLRFSLHIAHFCARAGHNTLPVRGAPRSSAAPRTHAHQQAAHKELDSAPTPT